MVLNNHPFGHVPLNRTFRELSSQASESDEYDLSKAPYVSEGLGWNELLKDFRVVVLSEAGSGKTEEFSTITAQLRFEGKDAYFLRLENVPEYFQDAFEVGDAREFAEWLDSGREGWLFLDSIDEARLRHPKDFELALRRLGDRLKLALGRTHIFLSGRSSAWRPKTDLDRARQHLPFSPATEVEADAGNHAEALAPNGIEEMLEGEDDDGDAPIGNQTTVPSSTVKGIQSTAPFRIVTLQDLSREQVEAFAHARGVSDTKDFGDAIARADAWSFAALPQDLDDLVASWLRRGKIGSRLSIVRDGVERRLKERDQDRAENVPLTEEKALEGARLLAAAVTLGRNPAIQVPDGADSLGGIPVDKVLPHWSAPERRALLERPIFDAAIYGSVRFHHRTMREYLTADWLRGMLSQPASRRAIEGIFFRTQYGIEVVVPVMRPVLPWMALFDTGIREHVQRIAPEVLFEGGDPTSLPASTRREILKKVTQDLVSGRSPNSPTDFAAVQRFASPDLGDDIRRLLGENKDNAEAATFLLRMVWLGQIKEALPEAKQQALLSTAGTYQRTAAFRAIDAIGTPSDMRHIRQTILAEGVPNRDWLDELVDTLKGNDEEIDWLLHAVAKTQAAPKHTVDHLPDGISGFARRAPLEKLPRLIEGFHRLLGAKPHVDAHFCKVSTQFSWLLHPAAVAIERLILARDPMALSPPVLGVLGVLPTSRHFETDLRNIKADFEKQVPAWPELNRTLLWAEVYRAREDIKPRTGERINHHWQAHSFDAFWKISADDFDYFCREVRERPQQDDKLIALSAAFEAYVRGGRLASARKVLKETASGDPELVDRLEASLHPPKRNDDATQQTRKWKRQAQMRVRRQLADRQKAREYMLAHIATIRDPGFPNPEDVSRTQWYLHQQTRDKAEQKGKWTTGNWRSLIPEFGAEVAAAYRDGAILHWRRASPKTRSEGAEANSTTASAIFGLTGLAIEARESPGWAENLGADDVVRACRFASHELNGFPEWLPKLYAAHPTIVAEFLVQEVQYELSVEPDDGMHYIVDDLAWSGQWAWTELGPRIFEILKSQEPRNGETLDKLMRIVLSSEIRDEDIVALTKLKLAGPNGGRHAVRWFAAWTGVDPEAAIPAFAQYLDQLPASGESADSAMSYLTHLFGDRYNVFPAARSAFGQPRHLQRLYLLMHRHIRRSEDFDRTGEEVYSPTLRDRAQYSRDAIFGRLNDVAGKDAYLAMTEIAKAESDPASRRWIEYRARRRAEQDGDMAAWSPEQVREFNDMQQRTPANHRELAELAVNHLLDLKDDLENGDSSIAALLQEVAEETTMRNFIGRELQKMGSGRYVVPQEEELADAKRPDLRIHGAGTYGPIPTELKLADNWTGPQLLERLENQLSGDYLRDRRSSRGVFLVVWRGKGKKYWHLPGGSRVDFDGLVVALQKHWEVLSPGYAHIDEVTVIGIDLTKRTSKQPRSENHA